MTIIITYLCLKYLQIKELDRKRNTNREALVALKKCTGTVPVPLEMNFIQINICQVVN